MPTPDPTLRHGPVQLPDDPTGIEEAHDVLAAEEFAMPAPVAGVGGVLERRGGARGGGLVLLAALALLALLLIGRRRRG